MSFEPIRSGMRVFRLKVEVRVENTDVSETQRRLFSPGEERRGVSSLCLEVLQSRSPLSRLLQQRSALGEEDKHTSLSSASRNASKP
jgi:hypothetical protein